MSINLRSVLTSGLVAGVVINVSAIGMLPVVGNEMDGVLAARGLPPLSPAAMAYFFVLSLVLGMVLVGVYAAVKAEFGPGMKTAVGVSVLVWFLAYFSSNASLAAYGFMPIRLVVVGTVWGLVELLLAGIVGSKLYKDNSQRHKP